MGCDRLGACYSGGSECPDVDSYGMLTANKNVSGVDALRFGGGFGRW